MRTTNLNLHEKINVKSFLNNLGYITKIDQPAFVTGTGVVSVEKIGNNYILTSPGVYMNPVILSSLGFENKQYRTI